MNTCHSTKPTPSPPSRRRRHRPRAAPRWPERLQVDALKSKPLAFRALSDVPRRASRRQLGENAPKRASAPGPPSMHPGSTVRLPNPRHKPFMMMSCQSGSGGVLLLAHAFCLASLPLPALHLRSRYPQLDIISKDCFVGCAGVLSYLNSHSSVVRGCRLIRAGQAHTSTAVGGGRHALVHVGKGKPLC